MNTFASLLELELGSPLAFPRRTPIPATAKDFFIRGSEKSEGALSAGEEELFVFGDKLLCITADGPRCRSPLPPPISAWTTRGRETGDGFHIETGSWLFMQWRPTSAKELVEGLEWFAREAWWEARRLRGPLLLRLVHEDGRLAWQLLRRLTR